MHTTERVTRIYVMDVAGSLYIGKTHHPLEYRKAKHIAEAFERKSVSPVALALRHAVESGADVVMRELELVTPAADWEEAERFWIASLSALGVCLLNASPGGKTTRGLRMTAEQRAAVSAAHARRKADPARYEAWRQQQSRDAIRWHSKNALPPKSTTTRAKLKAAKSAWWAAMTPERRAEMVAKIRGPKPPRKPLTAEQKANIAAGAKKSWADRKARSA